mgnify:CR=1 FL=1
MSVEKIIAAAIENNPLQMKKSFEEEIAERVQTALEEKYKKMKEEEDEAEDQVDDDDDKEEDDDNDDEVVGEMKKLHASNCGKMEMYKKVHEKYGTPKDKFEGLYAQYCK